MVTVYGNHFSITTACPSCTNPVPSTVLLLIPVALILCQMTCLKGPPIHSDQIYLLVPWRSLQKCFIVNAADQSSLTHRTLPEHNRTRHTHKTEPDSTL